jgi:hypothetical protein
MLEMFSIYLQCFRQDDEYEHGRTDNEDREFCFNWCVDFHLIITASYCEAYQTMLGLDILCELLGGD